MESPALVGSPRFELILGLSVVLKNFADLVSVPVSGNRLLPAGPRSVSGSRDSLCCSRGVVGKVRASTHLKSALVSLLI